MNIAEDDGAIRLSVEWATAVLRSGPTKGKGTATVIFKSSEVEFGAKVTLFMADGMLWESVSSHDFTLINNLLAHYLLGKLTTTSVF